MEKEVKQYIIIREDLGMSNGKLAAQSSHASMKVFFDKMKRSIAHGNIEKKIRTYSFEAKEEEVQWIDGLFTKIVKKIKRLRNL
jgi:peptidyl-tRNA hydrolase